jgi:hypothetical protein
MMIFFRLNANTATLIDDKYSCIGYKGSEVQLHLKMQKIAAVAICKDRAHPSVPNNSEQSERQDCI